MGLGKNQAEAAGVVQLKQDVIVRTLRNNEIELLVQLWDVCSLIRPWNDPRADIVACRNSPASELLVLCQAEGGESGILGSLMVGFDGHRGWFYYLAVQPKQQGRGYGRVLVSAGEEWLRTRGVKKINLMVRTENVEVMDFYRHQNYVDSEVRVLGKRLD